MQEQLLGSIFLPTLLHKPQGWGGRDCSGQSCGIASFPGGQCGFYREQTICPCSCKAPIVGACACRQSLHSGNRDNDIVLIGFEIALVTTD